MSAERLREAAKVLRKRAQAAGNQLAYPHPWGVREPNLEDFDRVGIAAIVTTNHEDDGEVTDWIDVDCAAHIATMHPGVGLALADWLDQIAETHEMDPGDYCAGEGHDGLPCSAWWCDNVSRALDVADEILGGAS